MSGYKLLINGALVDGDASLDVINPSTEELVATCARASSAQLDQAVAAAKAAFPAWSKTTMDERRTVLLAIADVLQANATELARLLTQEQGKPLGDATGEVYGASAFFRYFASLDLPAKVVSNDDKGRVEVRRRPLGVVGCIVPWNFPVMLMAFKVPAALLAGNTVILKPAATTPLTALKFGELIKDLVPPGVVNVIADNNDLGGAMTSHPDVRKISFTGSTETGKKVMASAASALKRISLELGGNDALIVMSDVDVAATAPKVFGAAMQNAGQVCIAAKRIYVHESIYDAMCDEFVKLADAWVVGDGLEQGTQMGPLQNKAQFDKVMGFLDSAKKDGKVIAGGGRKGDKGYFIQPTVVRDIAEGSQLVDEEQFGPVMPVIKYSDPADAVARANASIYGLGGSIWAKDSDRAWDLAEGMESGSVWINKHADLRPDLPFGGSKFSGIGSELGEEGLKEFTQVQVLNMAR
ncbi:MAG: aldehyde dehydrogenase family protein [Alphaproteobacteria bacterium]|nr:aldehyde dehydrogenase family protein [Alphaproteobacteria bacterium]MBU1512460.1 aldehyde dehydrogenase family protein [Alphaproteobacteria bacterium]MBU2095086.1 aldehyde dehydrogenase family protein [Alphaproteobacteria bacterium]MBU2151275.1 aldehyde dehydrogenase family protein [Alphaproteobacteria bacterium]MBU2308182.1 aldehyde dehydrogenase family protein [Alphaproteobacteria bacterium]